MNKILIISFVGVMFTTSLLTKDIVDLIKTKFMVKRTIRNCFKILKDKEVK